MKSEELFCAPAHAKFAFSNSTCFSYQELRLLAREFNKHNPNQKIPLKAKKHEIVQLLHDAYSRVCDENQFCWISQHLSNSGKKEKLFEAFRPEKPASWYNNPKTWLNTYDILYVMKQYEHLYKDFEFMGVYPIDFAERNSYGNCVGDLLCDLNISDLFARKKKRFGMVINTDPSTSGGQHWFSVFCSLDPKRKNFGFYYFDSVGDGYGQRVKNFIERIVQQVKEVIKTERKFEVKYNKRPIQQDGHSCGVYSIASLTQLLKDIPFDTVSKELLGDKDMLRLRNVLYRPHSAKI